MPTSGSRRWVDIGLDLIKRREVIPLESTEFQMGIRLIMGREVDQLRLANCRRRRIALRHLLRIMLLWLLCCRRIVRMYLERIERPKMVRI